MECIELKRSEKKFEDLIKAAEKKKIKLSKEQKTEMRKRYFSSPKYLKE